MAILQIIYNDGRRCGGRAIASSGSTSRRRRSSSRAATHPRFASRSATVSGDVDFAAFGFDAQTFVSHHKNRYLVGADELDAELAATGFGILEGYARPNLDSADDNLVRVARPRRT